ncbi:MAG: DUF5110 domain-containing protein [Spirochaetales bacterium]|nr:DUF5110 domain-containing protein [Spirochaetales bacterium]
MSVRVQSLTPGIIRIETSRPDGTFCDEPTFTVIARPGNPDGDAGGPANVVLDLNGSHPSEEDNSVARFGDLVVRCNAELDATDSRAPAGGLVLSLELARDEDVLWRAADDPGLQSRPPEPDRLPRPPETGAVWVLHDHPRVIPPEWGALPPPAEFSGPDSGWRLEEGVTDIYLCVYDGDLELLWHQFVSLTGNTPVPPLWMFGLWHSRYFPYSDKTALEVVSKYRELGFPLDCLVVDTDWRVGASRGYEINTELFPDMTGFLAECKRRGLHTVFNDHPEPKGYEPLQPELLEYRRQNLTRIMDMGLSTWWFDRNWSDIIRGPAPGLESAVWGQRLYTDIIAGHRPGERPAILSITTPHPAAHRFPIWWTGDIHSDWPSLAEAVRDSVDDGLQLRPYTAPDIGGHTGFPSPEQYVRWLQWGSVAPTLRLHSGPHNRFRYPWRFGETALSVSRDYVRMRYRLLPYIYSLAHEAHRTGTPMQRSMDLVASEAPVWSRSSQFLLGDALLVAPVVAGTERPPSVAPHRFAQPLRRRVWFDQPLHDETFGSMRLPEAAPDEVGHDSEIRINLLNASEKRMAWGRRFLVAWDGTFAVRRDGWYRIVLSGSGRSEAAVDTDGRPQIFGHFFRGDTEANLSLTAGTHHVTVVHRHDGAGAPFVTLTMEELSEPARLPPAGRVVWLPGGNWRDLWTGAIHAGPGEIKVEAGIRQMPMFARCGSVVPLTSVAEHTTTGYWDNLTIEVFPHDGDNQARFTLVEDDGHSVAYLSGDTADTEVTLARRGNVISLSFGADPATTPRGATPPHRDSITVRFHLLPGDIAADLKINGGRAAGWRRLSRADPNRTTPLPPDNTTAMFENGETVVVTVPWNRDSINVELNLQ